MPQSELLSAVVSVMAGLFIDSLPFLLGGSLLSVLIHEFVPARVLVSLFNRSAWSGVLLASLSGLFLPLCECGIVPIVKTLLHRGVRPAVAATAFFALPLVNPLVAFSTFAAFPSRPALAWGRLLIGWLVVILMGFVFILFEKQLFPEGPLVQKNSGASKTSSEDYHHGKHTKNSTLSRIIHIGEHTLEEVYSTGRYLVVGIILASFLQVLFSSPPLGFSGAQWVEPLVLMGLAFLLSLCSNTDAFVARGFQNLFSGGALLSFMLMGPLLHLRNLILLKGVFPLRTVLLLILCVCLAVYSAGALSNLWGGLK